MLEETMLQIIREFSLMKIDITRSSQRRIKIKPGNTVGGMRAGTSARATSCRTKRK